ncbi:hypothetical protein B0I37DRAFT_402132 [Chaetomium sp. MPI-CAGE-AT-0009]|nr:hypothetical protein B0I37DRAFT_402132 [Chaetomium sp. MPI-CAGE-AT-0009]
MADPPRLWERRNGARVSLASDTLQRALGTSLTTTSASASTSGPSSHSTTPAAGGQTSTSSSSALGSPFSYTGTHGSTTRFGALPRYEHRTTTPSHPSTLDDSSASTPTFQHYLTRRPSPISWYPSAAPRHDPLAPPTSAHRARSPPTRRRVRSPSPFRLRPSDPVLPPRRRRSASPSLSRRSPLRRRSPIASSFRLRPSPVLPRAYTFTTANSTAAYQPNMGRARSPPRGRSPSGPSLPYTPPHQITGGLGNGPSGDEVPGCQLWLNNQIRPRKSGMRRFTEYVAGIGMVQVNEHRRNRELPVFEFATILIGIHDSDSDDYRHVTIAAATKAMKEMGQHIVVHSRVSTDETKFIGSEAYEEYVRLDNDLLRASYRDPIPARTSFMPHDDGPGTVPVGHITYAVVLGDGQPPAPSPHPQPSNPEATMSEANPHTSAEQPTVEWVSPELKLDKNRAEPVAFSTKAGVKMRTGWGRWRAEGDDTGRSFVCVAVNTGNEYWTKYLPALESSSRQPERSGSRARATASLRTCARVPHT